MAKYAAMKTTMWGVFRVGVVWSVFRSLVASFAEKSDAEKRAKQYSADNFGCDTMIDEIFIEDFYEESYKAGQDSRSSHL